MEHLSNIELYYSLPENFGTEEIRLTGEDFYHAAKVMRHRENDIVFITDGNGKIFKCSAEKILKDEMVLKEIEHYQYENNKSNIFLCIPKLKHPDRFEFALEKCVELGIINFIVFDAERSVAKGNKIERWQKILLAAMKQSLRSYLPSIKTVHSLQEIVELNGKNFVFEQNTENGFNKTKVNFASKSYFIFGPEGGLSSNELSLFDSKDIYNISSNRLRSETALILAASLLN